MRTFHSKQLSLALAYADSETLDTEADRPDRFLQSLLRESLAGSGVA